MSWKWFKYFKHIFKSLGTSTCTTKMLKWLGIQSSVVNKDISCKSAFNRWASTLSRETIHRNQKKEEMPITHGQLPQKRQKMTMLQNQLNSVNYVVSVFGRNIQCKLAMVAYNEILFYISYSLQLAFHLCSSMIVFYISLEDLKLAFLENKSRYVCCIFANSIFTFETKS